MSRREKFSRVVRIGQKAGGANCNSGSALESADRVEMSPNSPKVDDQNDSQHFSDRRLRSQPKEELKATEVAVGVKRPAPKTTGEAPDFSSEMQKKRESLGMGGKKKAVKKVEAKGDVEGSKSDETDAAYCQKKQKMSEEVESQESLPPLEELPPLETLSQEAASTGMMVVERRCNKCTHKDFVEQKESQSEENDFASVSTLVRKNSLLVEENKILKQKLHEATQKLKLLLEAGREFYSKLQMVDLIRVESCDEEIGDIVASVPIQLAVAVADAPLESEESEKSDDISISSLLQEAVEQIKEEGQSKAQQNPNKGKDPSQTPYQILIKFCKARKLVVREGATKQRSISGVFEFVSRLEVEDCTRSGVGKTTGAARGKAASKLLSALKKNPLYSISESQEGM